ncbi:MAG: LysE family transporter [Bdellovibrionales bacterium]|nr:LysE family transporter [Bdellovibrionales bacterium]
MLETILLLTVVGLLGMMSPGPDFFLILRNASAYSRRAAIATAAGITVGIAVHVTYCVLGIGLIITKSVLLFNTIRYAGAAYLIYIGWKSLRSKTVSVVPDNTPKERRDVPLQGFIEGLTCNLLNPKATLFFLSVFTQMIDPNTPLEHQAVYGLVFVVWGIVYWSLLVLFVQHPLVQRLLTATGHTIDRVFGGILIALGLRVALID